jgi:HAMP domain-containing protein
MLRRKLLLNFGPIVALMLLTAIAAIWLLQGVLRDLNHINTEAWQLVEEVNDLSINVNAVEVELYSLQLGKQRHLDSLIEIVESTHRVVESLSEHYVMAEPQCRPFYQSIREQMPVFEKHVAAVATVQDPDLSRTNIEAALNLAVTLRQSTLPLSRFAREHAHVEQAALLARFRWLVLGLAIVFLLMINISVIVLLRLGSMVLKPVEKLLEGTRQVGADRFDYRVHIDERDEFGELARAYNSLTEQLQTQEQKRIQTLAQAAVTMNHELNNAISIIDLQLTKLSRQSQGDAAQEQCLRQIHDGLERVTQTVQSLKNIRRIVLTDYAPGTKMLDLRKSVEEGRPADSASSKAR